MSSVFLEKFFTILDKDMTVGERLKELRLAVPLKQKEFAEKMGVKQQSLARYEKNLRSPDYSFFLNLVRQFNVNLHWLFTGEGKKYGGETGKTTNLDSQTNEIIQFVLSAPKLKAVIYSLLRAQKTNAEITQILQALKDVQKTRYGRGLLDLLRGLKGHQLKLLIMVAKNMA